ncbi:MAG: MFS transporter [Proteobacteria bacterium]|nr:MAG: MFS transporter [Pseudomonadota bacterium]
MRIPRRQFLHLIAGVAALPALARTARAQVYPARPVRVLVGYAPGGPADTIARLISQALSERFGQPFVVENRPGAGSNIAADAASKAAPDGYTLLLATAANAINTTLYNDLKYDFSRDFAPVATLTREPLIMAVSPSGLSKTLPEFIAYGKAHPGKITMASAGNGTASHVSGELFKMLAGVDMVHVPYRGAAPALTDVFAGRVDIYFSPMSGVTEHIRAGKLRALAITTVNRSEGLPDVPSASEVVPAYEASQWYGLTVPKNTSRDLVSKLNAEINAILAESKFKQRVTDLGSATFATSPPDFEKLIIEETEKWAKVVKFSGAKPD